MSTFGGIILTNKGKNLQSKAQAGVALKYTRVGVGDGSLGTTSILSLNKLVNEVKSLSISTLKSIGDGTAVIGAVLSNQDMIQGFYFREIGLYATDPDLGEILYCYGNAGELAEYISPGGGSDIIEKSIDLHTSVGNAQNVTAVIDSSLVYATQSDVERIELRITDHENKKGQSNGYASLDQTGNVPETQLGNLPSNLETKAGAQEKVNNLSGVGNTKTVKQLDNELSNHSNDQQAHGIGDKSILKTTAKDSIVNSINSVVEDYVRSPGYASASHTGNVYDVTLNPAPTEYKDGMGIVLKAVNAGVEPKININGLGAKSILQSNGLPVPNLKANTVYTVRYNGTAFILQGEGGTEAKKELNAYLRIIKERVNGGEFLLFQNDDFLYTTERYNGGSGFEWYARKYDRKTGTLVKIIDISDLNPSTTNSSYFFTFTEDGIFRRRSGYGGLTIYDENKTIIKDIPSFYSTNKTNASCQIGRNNNEYAVDYDDGVKLFDTNGTLIATVISMRQTYSTPVGFSVYRKNDGSAEAFSVLSYSSDYYHYVDLEGFNLRKSSTNISEFASLSQDKTYLGLVAQMAYVK
ncbi:phage tail protein [Virgibacillus halodenitrificans]|uniref:phage tail-collar fiber domain-containing protein n=1 Tax=Virgibacillus halodenitrificans TaxID=1482 RepID=UPI00196A1C5C|nr:phage tail protein [Virgibacillus halodenitrificans]